MSDTKRQRPGEERAGGASMQLPDNVKKQSVLRVHITQLAAGIAATPEFERKRLAAYSVNVGTKCGHDCTYCSTGVMLRMHPSFKAVGEDPFATGFAIIDPTTPERVAVHARRIPLARRGLVQLCTTTDAWAPEAQAHQLGRRCLEAILAEKGWTVRILTKNAAVAREFDLIEKHRDRVLVGLSLTATPDKEDIVRVVEPHASPISARIDALREAHRRGLRTYAMLCPLLPGVADDRESINRLVQICIDVGAEEFFAEPLNARGRGLIATAEALRRAGFAAEADAIDSVRTGATWSRTTVQMLAALQVALSSRGALRLLRFMLYGARLLPDDAAHVRAHGEGVLWLGTRGSG